VRADAAPRAARLAGVALLLGVGFLGMQAWAWIDLWRAQLHVQDNLYAWSFYVLTGLHAAHVIGGLPPLMLVWWRARNGRYSAAHPEGAVYCAMYWHFLDAVWMALYATLWLGSLTW
jgi:heme/copper-type cytochrome/quinol oxidase subunit 3